MAYTDLTTNERIRYHETGMRLNGDLLGLNHKLKEALTSQERTALRQAAAPILGQLEALTYAQF